MQSIQEYLCQIKNRFDVKKFQNYLAELSKLNVMVIGDTILDSYVFVVPKGRAVKDPILSVEYSRKEMYAGGILAIANHISSFVGSVKLVTLIGDRHTYADFIKKSLKKNIEIKMFPKTDSPTTVKERMVDSQRGNKLFKIEYINDVPIDESLATLTLDYLNEELPKYDMVIVGDFGHGFLNDKIRKKIKEKSKFLALNVQTNSANMGYNFFNLYKKCNYLTMDEQELRLPLSMRFDDIKDVIAKFYDIYQCSNFLITLGHKGTILVNNGKITNAPVLITKVKDTIGAGDAVFAISSLFAYLNADVESILFIANCAGGIKVNIIGNKDSVTKEKLLSFIEKIHESVGNNE